MWNPTIGTAEVIICVLFASSVFMTRGLIRRWWFAATAFLVMGAVVTLADPASMLLAALPLFGACALGVVLMRRLGNERKITVAFSVVEFARIP